MVVLRVSALYYEHFDIGLYFRTVTTLHYIPFPLRSPSTVRKITEGPLVQKDRREGQPIG